MAGTQACHLSCKEDIDSPITGKQVHPVFNPFLGLQSVNKPGRKDG